MDAIITKFLQNRCSEAEKLTLFTWIEQSPDNLKYYIRIRQIWDMNSVLFTQKVNNEQLDEAFQRVQDKLQQNNPDQNIHHGKTNIIRLLLRYAAIVIICFGISWFFWRDRSEKREVAWQSIEVPAGHRAIVTLVDGTRVWLNSKTIFSYPQNFSQKNRTVKLNGEGYFDVFHNERIPFIVVTNKFSVTAKGTKFNVYAYDNVSIMETLLVEGRIEFSENKQKGLKLELKPEQLITYNASLSQINVRNNVDIQSFTSWTSGIYSFNNASLHEIIPRLENYYNIHIEVRDSSILDYTCTGKFRLNESLNDVLNVLSTGKPFKYKISDTKALIY